MSDDGSSRRSPVALVLLVYGDLSYPEIALHQGISAQTVKSRPWRARNLAEEMLAGAPGPAG